MPTAPADPDAALIPELKKGNEEVFRRLFEKYSERILSYVSPRSRSREDAEEITSDVFVRCYKGIS